jgi:formylglycine-generating enzyme required for sulfatase activity
MVRVPGERGFFIGRYETTWREYETFCRSTRHERPARPDFWSTLEDPEHNPVINVSFLDAEAYCQWAHLRLPSVEEWRKAARGSDKRVYPWGDKWDPARANFADARYAAVYPDDPSEKSGDDGYPVTAPVGRFPLGASPCGALDMAGNVYEICTDPTWSGGIFCGGSWTKPPSQLTVDSYTAANNGSARFKCHDLGFRVALDDAR